jgi:hypothetical protein
VTPGTTTPGVDEVAGTGTPSTTTPGVTAVNEQQTVTVVAAGGTFTLTYSGQTTAAIARDATAAAVQSALEGLSNVEVGDVSVAGSAGGPWTVTFTGALAGTNVDQMTSTATGLTGTAVVTTPTPGTGPTNEVQSVAVSADGGTFTLTYDGQTTSALAYNASAATVETALEALSTIEVGEATVAGGPGDIGGTTPYTVTFELGLGGTDVAALTANAGSLTLAASIVPTIQAQDPTSGDWYDVLVGAAIVDEGTTVLKVYPGITASANAAACDVLPAGWRLSVAASDVTPVTYSASAWVIP